MRAIVISTLVISLFSACSPSVEIPAGSPEDSAPVVSTHSSTPMHLSSTAFVHEGLIPAVYTCDGDNVSPPLSISGAPAEAKSLALVMDDPDVPVSLRADGLFVHWILADIAPATTMLPMGVDPASLGTPGLNTRGNPVYTGPCPPDREHRYFFKLYALDTRLDLAAAPTKDEVEKAMEGHIIAETTLMGRYDRPR